MALIAMASAAAAMYVQYQLAPVNQARGQRLYDEVLSQHEKVLVLSRELNIATLISSPLSGMQEDVGAALTTHQTLQNVSWILEHLNAFRNPESLIAHARFSHIVGYYHTARAAVAVAALKLQQAIDGTGPAFSSVDEITELLDAAKNAVDDYEEILRWTMYHPHAL